MAKDKFINTKIAWEGQEQEEDEEEEEYNEEQPNQAQNQIGKLMINLTAAITTNNGPHNFNTHYANATGFEESESKPSENE
jgi:hypothetical protein